MNRAFERINFFWNFFVYMAAEMKESLRIEGQDARREKTK
jgi:hypothetical protein